jgi:uncharacterized protein (TIGR02271 family)
MSKFLGVFGEEEESNQQMNNNYGNTTDSKNIVLHKEELDISKNMVQTGEVVLSKEIIEEQQTVDVPVMHEEIIIERRPLNNESSTTSSISGEETIRIPVNEEQVDVNKRTVAVEEVSLYKNEVQNHQQISETIQREDVSINTTGNANVVENTGYNTTQNGGDPNLGGNQGSWSDIEGENVDTSGKENYGGHQQLP